MLFPVAPHTVFLALAFRIGWMTKGGTASLSFSEKATMRRLVAIVAELANAWSKKDRCDSRRGQPPLGPLSSTSTSKPTSKRAHTGAMKAVASGDSNGA